MSADKKPHPFVRKDHHAALKEILNFGPDHAAPPGQNNLEFNERVQKILKQLQDINKRIDKLNDEY